MDTEVKQTSPLDNLYDEFEDFDLGQTVERLKIDNKMLKDHIKGQEKDIEKLANAVVEIKTVNQNLTNNIASLYQTAKTEIERKDNIIADLRREVDNFTFRRQGHKFQHDSITPQNKGNKKNSGQDPEPEVPNIEHINLDRPNNNNRGSVFQERFKNRTKMERDDHLDLPVPSFANCNSEKHNNEIARDNRFQDRHRSNNREEQQEIQNLDIQNARDKRFQDRHGSNNMEEEFENLDNPIARDARFQSRHRSNRREDQEIQNWDNNQRDNRFQERHRNINWEEQEIQNWGSNQNARDNRFQGRHRSNHREEEEIRNVGQHTSYHNHRSRSRNGRHSLEERRDRSDYRRNKYDRHEDWRTRDDANDNFSNSNRIVSNAVHIGVKKRTH